MGELETWLPAIHSEVCAALSESSSLAYIRMTCQTDDEAREKAYLHIVEVVDPWLKPRQFALLQKLVLAARIQKAARRSTPSTAAASRRR